MRRAAVLLSVMMATTPPASYAARLMITDDARTVDAKACQVESWVRTNRSSKEYWALPACNFSGNLEVTFGGAITSDAAGSGTTDVVLQGKTLFKTLEPDGWSVGLVMGGIRHPGGAKRVGVLHNTITSSSRGTWGVGTETAFAERTWFIAEAFQQKEGRPFFQAGVRHWIVPNRVQIDATYGNRFGSASDERWFSIGVRLLSPAFLP